MITINLSNKNDYYTQRNNTFYPAGSCNTTSMIVGLLTSNVMFDSPPDMQPEDYLTEILSTAEAWKKMDEIAPWARKQGYEPRHVHVCLEWAVNKKLVFYDVVQFRMNVSMKQIVESILKGSSVVVNGGFTNYGHIVTIVGIKTHQDNIRHESIDMSKIESFIIDDPYGNYHTGYKDHHGNDIEFSFMELNKLLYAQGDSENKWAHVFNGVL